MHKIDVSQVDLNLLLVFETLMDERNVSGAARRLGLTQPAVSHALARLRTQLGDPLLVRMGGRMEPSPFAAVLVDSIRPHLRGLASALNAREEFHPATSRRIFRVAMPDFALQWVTDLLQRFRGEAPSIEVHWSVPTNASLLAVAEGRIDLALMPHGVRKLEGISSRLMGESPWACYLRAGHPALSRWDSDAWAAWQHLQVGACDATQNPVAEAAAERKLERRLGASVPSFGLVAPLLERTDLIATMPMMALGRACQAFSLVQVECPLPIPPMSLATFWSARTEEEAGGRWLRQAFEAVALPSHTAS